MPGVELAVIGGSGFYELLTDAVEEDIETPFGAPSAPIAVGRLSGRRVAFLPRHGVGHHLPPHRVPYRANLWALRQLGVTRVLAPCAAGSLRADIHPGEFVVCDQFVDRTWGRPDTFFDGPQVHHVSLADPYCPEMRAATTVALTRHGATVHGVGTVVVVQGPRFSTRAESAWYRAAGWDVVNMTQYPEVALARELGMCYAGLALVTDYDTGVERDAGNEGAAGGVGTHRMEAVTMEAVTMEAVWAVLRSMLDTVRAVTSSVAELLPAHRACACGASVVPDPPS